MPKYCQFGLLSSLLSFSPSFCCYTCITYEFCRNDLLTRHTLILLFLLFCTSLCSETSINNDVIKPDGTQ